MINKCVSAPAKGAAIMQKTQNLQDAFLNYIRREKIPVTLFLMNGFQLRGVVRSFDSFVVLIDADGRQQMIYKHAISTVAPARPAERRAGFEENEYLHEHRHVRALRGHARVSGRVPVSLDAAILRHRPGGARDRQRERTGQRHRRARGAGHRLGQGISVPVRGRRQGGRKRR